MRSNAEAEIRHKMMPGSEKTFRATVSSVGDTTLPIEEVATLLSTGEETLTNAEELIYGDTPMCEALTKSLEDLT